jgi:O-acetyl-ADP-ribose deacetylase
VALAIEHQFQSMAMPLIGAGSGGFKPEKAQAIIEDELAKLNPAIEVTIVVFAK